MKPMSALLRPIVHSLLVIALFQPIGSHGQTMVVDPLFNVGTALNGAVQRVVLRSDGKLIALGEFTQYGGIAVGGIVLLNADGSMNPSFGSGTGFNGSVHEAVAQPDGKILVCGAFTSYNGVALPGKLIRLLPDGTLDPSFITPVFGLASVADINLLPDGKILLAGNMAVVGQTNVCRLLPNGSPDPTFHTWLAFNASAHTVSRFTDGKVLVAGFFTMVHGVPRSRVCVLNADGSLFTAFDPGSGLSSIPLVAIATSTNRIILAGLISSYNSVPIGDFVALDLDGTVDETFVAGSAFTGAIAHVSEMDDGRLWVSGQLFSYNGVPVARVCRLLPNGTLDPVFTATNAVNFNTIQVVPAADAWYLAGNFTIVDGLPRTRIARIRSCATSNWYADADGDGLGDVNALATSCVPLAGRVTNDDDCDDTDPLVLGPTAWYTDQDGDGFGNVMAPTVQACSAPLGYVAENTDCNDFDPTVHAIRDWYADVDGDGTGDSAVILNACTKPTGYVANGTDCDDSDPLATIIRTWYTDGDGDGFGNLAAPTVSCTAPPNHVTNNTDCNDAAPWITGPTTWYLDNDGDGLGQSGQTTVACAQPAGYSDEGYDCDDNDPEIYLYALCDDGNPLTYYDAIEGDCTCRGQGVRVAPVVFLDVPRTDLYLMQATLFDLGLIPLQEPYTALGYDFQHGVGGFTTTPEMLNPYPMEPEHQAVDWVVVEFRSEHNPGIVVASHPCLLSRSGNIRRPDKFDSPEFSVPQDHYFVSVRHRTHLGVMTSTAIPFVQPALPLLVMMDGQQPLAGGANATKPNGEVSVLWQGDVLSNGDVRYTGANNDRDAVLQRIGGLIPTNTVLGYYNEDVNMDGVVRYTGSNNDRDVILQTIGGTVPTAVRFDHIPD